MDKIFSQEPINETGRKIKNILPPKTALYLLILLLFLNLIFLDVVIFQGGNIKTIEKIIQTPITRQVTGNNDENFCSQACITRINQITGNLNKITPVPSSTPVPVKIQTTTSSTNTTKEYYVPFGSGSGSSSDWQDVAGLQASVDSNAYGSIKNVVFEASLHVPTANETASVRLYNATDGHPVWNSQVDFKGSSDSVLLTSNAINLDSGNKLYKVQMLTQLQSPAVLDQSRLHITTH